MTCTSVSCIPGREVTGMLEWEISDLRTYFSLCQKCVQGEADHGNHDCTFGNLLSPPILVHVDDDEKYTKWRVECRQYVRYLSFGIRYDGFYTYEDRTLIKNGPPFHFRYEVTLTGGTPGKMRRIYSTGGSKTSVKRGEITWICADRMKQFFTESYGVWPHGSLKISVKIYYLDTDPPPTVFDTSCGLLLNNQEMSDVQIHVGNSTFFAHKFVLSLQSRVFRSMFETPMRESRENEVKIFDIDAQTVELMLEFIYRGSCKIPDDPKCLLPLLDSAEKYGLDRLKAACFRKMVSGISDQNCAEFALAAHTYSADSKAAEYIQTYCVTNHARLIKIPEYRTLFLITPQAFIL